MNPSIAPTRAAELDAAKRDARRLLLLAAATFGLTLLLPPNFWVLGLRACAEAAMIGGLADWFAVVALFHRIPTGVRFITDHTAILPASKDRIADNLARFVKDQFLDPESLVALIRQHDPAARAAQWLATLGNGERLAGHVLATLEGMLRLVDERHVRKAIRDAVRAAIGRVDLSGTTATVLRSLTEQGRHQELLEQVLEKLLQAVGNASTRRLIAEGIVNWLRSEHRLKEKILPTEWLGEHGAAMVADAIARVLDQVRQNPAHTLRAGFDDAVAALVQRLDDDEVFRAKGEELKHYILEDEGFGDYVDGLWGSLREWLMRDLHDPRSLLHAKLREACGWLARRLADDPALRAELNAHLEQAARKAAPDFAQFLTAHIRDTIRNWDAKDMAREIELNIGKDLQVIRVNGTLVGGAIGLVLYLLSQVPGAVSSF